MVSQYNYVYTALMSAAGSCNYVWLSDRDSENPQNRLYFTSKGEIHGYIRQNPFCIAPCFFIKKDALVMTDILQCEVPDTLQFPSGKDLFGCLALILFHKKNTGRLLCLCFLCCLLVIRMFYAVAFVSSVSIFPMSSAVSVSYPFFIVNTPHMAVIMSPGCIFSNLSGVFIEIFTPTA